ncbi:beta-propeller domain-containing protein [Halobacteriaceae archaeon GCM10025711]
MPRITALVAVAAVVLAGVGGYVLAGAAPLDTGHADPGRDDPGSADRPTADGPGALEQFDSQAAFRDYLERSRMASSGPVWQGAMVGGDAALNGAPVEDAEYTTTVSATKAESGSVRASGTNVQEAGVDEPDRLKNAGDYLYYTSDLHPKEGTWSGPGTSVVSARPPENASVVGTLEHSGDLLMGDDTLVVLGDRAVHGYDLSDPASPEHAWTKALNASVRTARLHDGTLYLVLATGLADDPCPVTPLAGASVTCTDVYHPAEPTPVDVTYTAVTLDATAGDVGDSLSFLGSSRSVVYMSEQGLYVTYADRVDRGDVAIDFLLSDARSLLDDRAVERLERVRGYELSDRATWVEVNDALESWVRRQDSDDRERLRTELADRFAAYVEANRRTLSATQVVRLDLEGGLSVAATGTVPGTPLNQFSLDEHDGHLRVATTLDPPRMWGQAPTVNDVYVLDGDLDVAGKVTGMGETERVYAVRFTGDTGYVVTYRRVDPFHVLDLSDPENPTLEGELKLPGYSSYLHPLGDDRVLGIGEEDGRVKAVVFDVSDPANPTVADDAVLADRYSEIARTHHAFLLDPRHEVFFLPASGGGHVYSYADGLEEVHTVDVTRPRRAAYVGDYLYVFGDTELVVVDERTWERVRTVDL